MTQNELSDELKKYSFLPVPRIDRREKLNLFKGIILLNGANAKAEVLAKTTSDVHELLENFVLAVSDIADSQFAVKLVSEVFGDNVPKHPANPDWAYSKISISDIPTLNISDDAWSEIVKRVNAFCNGTSEEDNITQDRFLFHK